MISLKPEYLAMPKSDTWPGSIAKEPIGEMDSADSCDSVLSSCFSEDSLQYLSAEEKACLMFLEETIDALDTDEDSGLSNDEAENLPALGNVATKTAFLSASMNQSKHKDIPKHYIDDPRMFGSSEHNQILNYLVPTPFVLANGSPHSPPKPGPAAFKEKPSPKDSPHVPSEVNVVVIPPPLMGKTKNTRDQGLQTNDRTPRGPLTYEGLAQLRNKVSSRKYTDNERQTSTHQDPVYTSSGTQVFAQNIQPRDNRLSKNQPPAVAPKPKKIPSSIGIAVLNHKATTDPSGDDSCLSTSPGTGSLMKPEKVRLEALSKLGLLKESDRKPSPDPNFAAVRNQEFNDHSSQVSNVLRPRAFTDLAVGPSRLQQHSTKSAVGKAATLERSGMGLGSQVASKGRDLPKFTSSVSQNRLQCSSTDKNKLGNVQRATPTPMSPGKPTRQSSTVVPVASKSLPCPGLKVVRVPNMGEDRREALRKLGLLKN